MNILDVQFSPLTDWVVGETWRTIQQNVHDDDDYKMMMIVVEMLVRWWK